MRIRSRSGAAISAAVLTLIGIGIAVTTTATRSTASSPSVSLTDAGSKCVTVYKIAAPTSDSVGELCTSVVGTGTTIGKVTITFTAVPSCEGSVLLRASGIDQDGTEFDRVSTVTCASGPVSAAFRQVTQIASGTDICGLLIAPETYTGAEACVPIA